VAEKKSFRTSERKREIISRGRARLLPGRVWDIHLLLLKRGGPENQKEGGGELAISGEGGWSSGSVSLMRKGV